MEDSCAVGGIRVSNIAHFVYADFAEKEEGIPQGLKRRFVGVGEYQG